MVKEKTKEVKLKKKKVAMDPGLKKILKSYMWIAVAIIILWIVLAPLSYFNYL